MINYIKQIKIREQDKIMIIDQILMPLLTNGIIDRMKKKKRFIILMIKIDPKNLNLLIIIIYNNFNDIQDYQISQAQIINLMKKVKNFHQWRIKKKIFIHKWLINQNNKYQNVEVQLKLGKNIIMLYNLQINNINKVLMGFQSFHKIIYIWKISLI